MKAVFDEGTIELTLDGRDYRAQAGEDSLEVSLVRAEEGVLELRIDGRAITAYISMDGARRWVTIGGRTFQLIKSTARRSSHAHLAPGELTAPMPGQIRAVNVGEGETVAKGQTLILLEAMKMEIRVQSPQEGKVKAVHVRQGQTVEREQLLIEVE
jgi:biotin carboxyl carrier protein